MSEQPVQQHQNSVQCFRCGMKFIAEVGENPLDKAVKNGWVNKHNKIVCPYCKINKRRYNDPYSNYDKNFPETEHGVFMNTKGEEGTICVWKLILGIPPTWSLHKIEESFSD